MVCNRCGIENAPLAETCCKCGAVLAPKSAMAGGPAGTTAMQSINVGALGWYLTAMKKYAVFTGRSPRREFWYFFLFNNLILIALTILDGLIGTAYGLSPLGVLGGIFAIATFIPAIAVSVRRLHDLNLSGWLFLLTLVPLIGSITLLVLCAQDSKRGKNRYSSSPKAEPGPSILKPAPAADLMEGAPANLAAASAARPQTSSAPVAGHPESQESVPPQVHAEVPAAIPAVSRTKGRAMNSADGKLLMSGRGFLKWAILAVVGMALVMVCALGLITFRSFTRYKYLEDKGMQFRIDRYSGRTDELAGTSGWVPVSFNRPLGKIPVTNIHLSGVRWFGDRICTEINNESDYVVKSVTVQMCANAKGCDQNPFDEALQAHDGGPALSLQPVGPLLQKGETGTFCTNWDGATHSTAGSSGYTVLGAKGWKNN